MAKSHFVRETEPVVATSDASGAQTLDYRSIFDSIAQRIPSEMGLIITSLPRGTMQIVQPPRLNDGVMKSYARDYHGHDRPAWEAIIRRQPVRGADCWPERQFEASAYSTGFLSANGLRYVVAAPLRSPVMDGYPGAIELFRTAEQGAFNADTMNALASIAADLERTIHRERASRQPGSDTTEIPFQHKSEVRVFAFDPNLRIRVSEAEFATLDKRLQQNMLDLARQRFGQVNGKQMSTDRVSLPDSRGDLWNFRVVTHTTYPALGDGPFVFFCIQPDCADWGAMRPEDFAADPEVARLIPAVKFMQQEFSRGPTLQEIARTVHLSPFHFHRRFTELLGITPKHLLLDCQIEAAKTELLSRQKELAEIARACGFAHQSHFTSRFKQATGLTPTRWRRLAADRSNPS